MEKNRHGFAPAQERGEQTTQATNVYELDQFRSSDLQGLRQDYTDELRTFIGNRATWLGSSEGHAFDSGVLTRELSSDREAYSRASGTYREAASETLRTYAVAAEQFIDPKDKKSRHWRRIRNEVRERGSTPGAIEQALDRAVSTESRRAMLMVLDHEVQNRIDQKIARHGVEAPDLLELPTLASNDESQAALRLSLDAHIWTKAVDVARRDGPDSADVQRLINRATLPESQQAMRQALDDFLWKTLNTVAPALSVASTRVQQLLHCASSDGMRRAFFRQFSDQEHKESQRLRSMTHEDLIRMGAAASRYILDRGDLGGFNMRDPNRGNGGYHKPASEIPVPTPVARPDYEYEIDAAINALRAGGIPDNKIERRLARRYHPESGGDTEAMQYLTKKIRD